MDLLLARPALAGSPLPYALRRQAARQVLDEYRAALRAGALSAVPGLDELEQSVLRRGAELARPALGRVINATGVVLHTNLRARAPLSPRAAAAVGEAARGYSNLEYDLSAAAGPPGGGRRVPPVRPHRRGGGPGGQQQRRRRVSPPLRPGGGAGGGHLPGGAGGDRRGLPGARHPGPQRGPAGGGGHHQQDPPGRLRRRPGCGGGPGAAQGAPQQLPGCGLHPGGLPARAGRSGPEAGGAAVLRPGLRRPWLPGAGRGGCVGRCVLLLRGQAAGRAPGGDFAGEGGAARPSAGRPPLPRLRPASWPWPPWRPPCWTGGTGRRCRCPPCSPPRRRSCGGGRRPWPKPSPPPPCTAVETQGEVGGRRRRDGAARLGRRPLEPAEALEAHLRAWRVPILGRIHRGKLLLDVRTLLPGDEAEIAAALAAWREERA